jgi:uncharacterized protein YeaO (DUF488 family)
VTETRIRENKLERDEVDILLKRAYEKPEAKDGFRVLVDRLWPRGIKKADLHLDAWAKEIAPSTELRKWFGHDPTRWTEFCKRYKLELKNPEAQATIAKTVQAAQGRSVITLIYGAKDSEHNEAIVLLPFFRRTAARHSGGQRER